MVMFYCYYYYIIIIIIILLLLLIIGGKARRNETTRKTKKQVMDNIRMDLGEARWCDVDWIGLAQDRKRWRALVNSVSNIRVP
jgi:hypothetical protein